MMHPDIESYLNGELSGEALEQFQLELSRNPAMQEELERLKPVWQVLGRVGIAKKVEDVMTQRKHRRHLQRNITVAGICLLTVAVLFWWNRSRIDKSDHDMPTVQDTTSGQMIPNVFRQDTTLEKGIPKVARPQVQKNITQARAIALNYYHKSPPEAVLYSERSAIDTSRRSVQIQGSSEKDFAQAVILFEQGRYTQAKKDFLFLADLYPAYKDHAEWYAMLSALAEPQPDIITARQLSNRIITDPNHHTYLGLTRELLANSFIISILK